MRTGINIEQTGSKDSGLCDCCGRSSRRVWGLASAGMHGLAAYYVHWTLGHVLDRGANIDLVVGKWGEGTTSADRSAIALAYRLLETGPSIMTIDAGSRSFSSSPLVAKSWDAMTSLNLLLLNKHSLFLMLFWRRMNVSPNCAELGASEPLVGRNIAYSASFVRPSGAIRCAIAPYDFCAATRKSKSLFRYNDGVVRLARGKSQNRVDVGVFEIGIFSKNCLSRLPC
jgi:hypothetical protein